MAWARAACAGVMAGRAANDSTASASRAVLSEVPSLDCVISETTYVFGVPGCISNSAGV